MGDGDEGGGRVGDGDEGGGQVGGWVMVVG